MAQLFTLFFTAATNTDYSHSPANILMIIVLSLAIYIILTPQTSLFLLLSSYFFFTSNYDKNTSY